jgi:hypothetical protein
MDHDPLYWTAVLAFLIAIAIWGEKAICFLLPEPEQKTDDRDENPGVYTAQTVDLLGMHFIRINGTTRQKFHVQRVDGPWFYVRVFPYGDDGFGQGHVYFEGWTTELWSNHPIHPSDLQKHREIAKAA